jgi:hypothetical protein
MGQTGLAGHPDQTFRHVHYPENLFLSKLSENKFFK